ncbi:MAG: hypothetical protein J1F02_01870 [Lachnospiraceae bacterium]|nr:hypothetical protein [Lachnospiraceae bacterium]
MGIFDGLAPAGSKTGISSITTGVVKENWDGEHPGMVKAEYFLGNEGSNVTSWLPVASPYAFQECGMYLLPEVGAEVVIAFHMGDRNCPVVIGSLWNGKNTLPPETAMEKNTVKRLKTKGGCEIVFNDEEGKESISIQTPGQLQLKIEDEKQTIVLQDKEGKNGVSIQGEEGTVTVRADKKMVLEVGGDAILTLDGSAKSAALKADTITEEASQTLKLKGQNTSLEGGMLEIKGESSLKAESSGMAEIKGTMVKIN